MNRKTSIYQLDRIELEQVHRAIIDRVKQAINRVQLLELYVYRPYQLIEGIGLSWSNPMHPTAKYLQIVSLDGSKRLMEMLLLNKGQFDIFIYACDEVEHETMTLLNAYEFSLFRKTYTEEYTIPYLLSKLKGKLHSEEVVALDEIISNPDLEEQLIKLVKNNYEQTHLDNAVKALSWHIQFQISIAK